MIKKNSKNNLSLIPKGKKAQKEINQGNKEFSNLHLFPQGKKAQNKMSFGMIFTVFLIAVFLGFAFFGIRSFLGSVDESKILKFKKDLQGDIDDVWNDLGRSSQPGKYLVPDKIIKICVNQTDTNNNFLIYYEDRSFPEEKKLEHLNMEKTLDGKKGVCFENKNGKIEMMIKKGSGEQTVTLEKISE
jgi:hypothetical protein